jgi:FlaA1/EpsC-like NDP-sugar epimerase
MNFPVLVPRLLAVACDVASWLVAFFLSVLLRYKDSLTDAHWVGGFGYAAVAIVVKVVAGFGPQTYLGRSRVGSFAEATFLGASVVMISISLGIGFSLADRTFPRGLALAILALTLMANGRWAYLVLFRDELRRGTCDRALAAVVNGGEEPAILGFPAVMHATRWSAQRPSRPALSS